MSDINAERLQEMIDCPESSEVNEVRDVSRLLVEAQDMLTVRNHQNRTLADLTREAGERMDAAERKHNQLQQIVIGSLTGLGLCVLVWATITFS